MAVMPDVNENDARAAMKVWAENIVNNGVVRADPNVLMFHDFASMSEALHNRAVDGVVASTSDYFAIRQEVDFNHFVFAVTAGSIYDQYILLVHQDSGLAKVDDLRGRSLNILRHTRTSLAPIWLDTLLLEKGLKPAQDFCSGITEETKLAQTVLPVFFHKADACLVTLKGFKTMSELNPQLGRQLRVLATSPELVPSGFFFRTGYPQAQQKQCLAEFTRVHTTATGQQILTVFQTERLEECPASVLDSALNLLTRHQQLLNQTNSATVTVASLPRDGAAPTLRGVKP
jgi:phosphonate transport system substrate-binding protein